MSEENNYPRASREIVKMCVKAQEEYLKTLFEDYEMYVQQFEKDGIVVKNEHLSWNSLLDKDVDEGLIEITKNFSAQKNTLYGFLPEIITELKIELQEDQSGLSPVFFTFYSDVVVQQKDGVFAIMSYEYWDDGLYGYGSKLRKILFSFVKHFREQFIEKGRLSFTEIYEAIENITRKKREIFLD